jgi:hypothetical protein
MATETGEAAWGAGARAVQAIIAAIRGRADDAYDEFVRIYDIDDPTHHRVPSFWYVGELAEAAAIVVAPTKHACLIHDLESLGPAGLGPRARLRWRSSGRRCCPNLISYLVD